MFQIANSSVALCSEKRCSAVTSRVLEQHKLVLGEPKIIKEEEEQEAARMGSLLALQPLKLKKQAAEETLALPVKLSSFSEARTGSCSPRESLLAEAWERKRGHNIGLHKSVDNTHNIKPKPKFITDKRSAKAKGMTRSASYCGQAVFMASPAGSGSPSHAKSLSDDDFEELHAKSLTDDDFEELKGCIDLGFGFDKSSIRELCHILPALQACYAVTHSFHESSEGTCPSPPSTPSWKITSPGDNPEDVKARLRHWAQAVACNLRLCEDQ